MDTYYNCIPEPFASDLIESSVEAVLFTRNTAGLSLEKNGIVYNITILGTIRVVEDGYGGDRSFRVDSGEGSLQLLGILGCSLKSIQQQDDAVYLGFWGLHSIEVIIVHDLYYESFSISRQQLPKEL